MASEGDAEEGAVAAALKHPVTPLRRAVGSDDAFALKPKSLPKVPAGARRPKAAKGKAKASAPEPPADRRALDAAEAALKTIDQRRKREEADLAQRQADLDDAKADAQVRFGTARKAASAAVVKTRRAYRAAGGRG